MPERAARRVAPRYPYGSPELHTPWAKQSGGQVHRIAVSGQLTPGQPCAMKLSERRGTKLMPGDRAFADVELRFRPRGAGRFWERGVSVTVAVRVGCGRSVRAVHDRPRNLFAGDGSARLGFRSTAPTRAGAGGRLLPRGLADHLDGRRGHGHPGTAALVVGGRPPGPRPGSSHPVSPPRPMRVHPAVGAERNPARVRPAIRLAALDPDGATGRGRDRVDRSRHASRARRSGAAIAHRSGIGRGVPGHLAGRFARGMAGDHRGARRRSARAQPANPAQASARCVGDCHHRLDRGSFSSLGKVCANRTCGS